MVEANVTEAAFQNGVQKLLFLGIFHMWRDSATVSKGFRRLTVRAGVDDFRFHDLRHEGVSRLFETTDLTDSEIMSITGHTSSEMLKAYSALRPNALARLLDGEKR